MQLAKVIGTIVSTHKEPTLRGKLLLLQYLDEQGNLLSKYEVAADQVGAGVDEWVLVSCGSAARQIPGNENRPLDALVVGIVDTVSVGNSLVYSKKDEAR